MTKRVFFWEKREDLCSSKVYPGTWTNLIEKEIIEKGFSETTEIIALEAYEFDEQNMTTQEAHDYLENVEMDKEKERCFD
jgi:hypothetical protein